MTDSLFAQSWKAMLGADSFVKAGWVHSLRAHQYSYNTKEHWLVMGKVVIIIIKACNAE